MSLSILQDKWIFAYQAAKRFLFNNEGIEFRRREDLFSQDEWNQQVELWIPKVKEWKDFLSQQNYQVGDYVISAQRMLSPNQAAKNQPPLENDEIEDN